MNILSSKLRSTALAALLSVPLASGAALAQDTQQSGDTATQDATQNSGQQQSDSLGSNTGECRIVR